ncbi:MAG: ComF family protein [Phycisphaerales bacterium]
MPGFPWPPRPNPAAKVKTRPRRRADPALSMMQQTEAALLEYARAPFPLRADLDGWRPDGPERYCHRCGQTADPFAWDATGCPRCRDQRFPWARIVRLGAYVHPLTHYVRDLKFARFRPAGAFLGGALGEALEREVAINARTASGAVWRPRLMVVPMPMSPLRRISRGIDHARVLARGVASVLGAGVHAPLRRRFGPPQVNLPASGRQANVARSMSPSWLSWRGPLWRAEAEGSLILLIDDVTTTGSTLRECCRALREGFKARGRLCPAIWVGVAAVAGDDPARSR